MSDTYTPTSDDEGDTLTATASYTDAEGPGKTEEFPYPVDRGGGHQEQSAGVR